MSPLPAQVGRRRLLAGALGLGAVGALSGCASLGLGRDYARGSVQIATGGTEGVYFSYGVQLAKVVSTDLSGVQMQVRRTAGSVENLRRIRDDSSNLAFSAADAAADAVRGTGMFTGRAVGLSALARVYDDYLHLVVPSASRVREIGDLAGLRVSVGSAGSGTQVIADRLLALADLDARADLRAARLGINDSVAAMLAGKVDAFFWSGGLPTGGVARLAREIPIRMVPLGGLADELRSRYNPSYRAAAVPDRTYAGVPGIATIAVPNYVVAAPSTDDGLAREITRLMFASRGRLARAVPLAGVLDARVAIETAPVPLHPGALDYYREVKR